MAIEILKTDVKKFTHIVHLADCHIRLLRRHEEYLEVFSRLYEEIKKTPESTAICVLGDVVHSKVDLSPECVQTTKDFLVSLSDLRPTVLVAGNHDCYTPDHELLTKNGWVSIKNYVDNQLNNEVATFNENTKELEFQKPVGLMRKLFCGEMYSITGKSVDICVTPTHQVLYYHTQTNRFYKKNASNIPKTGLIPINGTLNNYVEDEYYKLLGFTFAESTFVLRSHKNKNKNKCDGCRIQFHLKCEREINYLTSVLNKLGYKSNIRRQKDGSVFIVIYSNLAKKIYEFFDGKKEIPNKIFSASNFQIKSFIDGYLNGDGHKFKNKYNYWSFLSISKESIDKLYTLSRFIGASSTKSNRIIFGNYQNSKQQYLANININNRINNTSIKQISKINYDGLVYCVSVPNTNLLIKRNEKISICGNCNLTNKNRLDSLSPIVDAIKHPNLHYLTKSGLYALGNICFSNMSVFDNIEKYILFKDIPQIYKNTYEIFIPLIHAPIDNALTDLGYRLNSRTIKAELFDGYDTVLCGDIHKMQDLYIEKEIDESELNEYLNTNDWEIVK